MFVRVVAPKSELVKVTYPKSLTSKLFVNRGETGATGPVGPTGATGATGASYTPGDPIYALVRNTTGATLPKGTIVYTSGANGNHVEVSPALATGDATSARTLGWLSTDLAHNADGYAMVEGYLEGLNTQGMTAGSQLYLSGTTAGGFTATKPVAPTHLVYVGVVAKVSAGDGHVYVKVQNGYELDELHDVLLTSKTNGDLLKYDSATGLWKNSAQSTLTVAQSQVTNLTTDLAAKADLAGGNSFTGAQVMTGTATGSVVAIIKGTSGQTANYFQIQNNAGTPVILADTSNSLFVPYGSFTTGTGSILGRLSVVPSAAQVGAVIRGAASQSASLQEWQNSAGTVLARVLSDGQWVSSAINTSNNYIRLLEANSGGTLQLTRMTAAAGNPGANVARLFLRDGTNAGTLKLVVRAGAAGAETTILDNIPQ